MVKPSGSFIKHEDRLAHNEDTVTPFLAKVDLPNICAIQSSTEGEIMLTDAGDAYFIRYWEDYRALPPVPPYMDGGLGLYTGLGEYICEPLKIEAVQGACAAACSHSLFAIACRDGTFYSFGVDNVGSTAALGQGPGGEMATPSENESDWRLDERSQSIMANPLLTLGRVRFDLGDDADA